MSEHLDPVICKLEGRWPGFPLYGCGDSEIQAVAQDQGGKLPAVFMEFLRKMGRSASLLFVGSDFGYPAMLGLRGAADELLVENGNPFILPADALVFWMHQGYQFAWLVASEGDDPPVYHYCEGEEDRPSRGYSSFSEFLREAARGRV